MSNLFVKALLVVRGEERAQSHMKQVIGSFLLSYGPGMINCRQFHQFLLSYIDGELTLKQQSVFDNHMLLCPMCKAHFETYVASIKLGQAVFEIEDDPLPADMPEELVTAVLDTLRQRD